MIEQAVRANTLREVRRDLMLKVKQASSFLERLRENG
jgi:hypothetical protein